ncbi:hypothetical protein HNR19_002816 [Nocardioides thalensis]|uniref:Uncharacterized protein n=1 Tax=Nocardioides thalensis TaxID=1914755 RepID=A0A853C6L2_9ACTN|nr:hypothetical protein [Nocardioides thalensis]NYJ02118.1 hypothetical protein [Nocardioides thalensis]
MYRCVFKIFVSLALALGLTTVVVSTTSAAHAAPASAGVTRAAADCSAEQSTLDSIRAKRKATKQKLAKAKRIKKRTAVQLRRAKANDNRARVIKLKRKMKKLTRQIRKLTRRVHNQNRAVQAAKAVLAECQDSGGTGSPIQDLCPPLPQALCDGLGGAIPGGSADSPLQALCDAVPQLQPLCDAAGGAGLPTELGALTDLLQPLLDAAGLGDLLGGGLPSLDALCGAGLPLPAGICDALGGEGVPTELPLDQVCEQLPGLQALCDALEGGGLPTDPAALTGLLQPIFDALGIGDLLGGLLGGGLPTLDSLCGTGLPLTTEICEAMGGAGVPTELPLDQVCEQLPGLQALCDALEGGGLPTNPEALTGLLEPILEALGLGDLIDDLLGGLLGGILGRQAAA